MRRLLLPALLATTLLATGCGRGEDAAAGAALSAATGHDVDIATDGDEQVVTIKTDEGEVRMTETGDLGLPEGFPSDLAMPGDIAVRSTAALGPALTVSVQDRQPLGASYDAFRQAQLDGGWTETMSMKLDGTAMLGLEKDERAVLANFVAEDEDTTRIGITVQPKGR